MSIIRISKTDDECLSKSKYDVFLGTKFYAGNLSKEGMKRTKELLLKKGHSFMGIFDELLSTV